MPSKLETRLLFAQRSANRDGSTISGLMAVSAFLDAGMRVTVVFGHDGPMQDDYRKLGCEVETLAHGDWLGSGGFLRSLKRVFKEWVLANSVDCLFADRRFDLVYVNSLVSMCFARYARRHEIPCVWHVRELFSDVGGEMVVPSFGGKRLVRSFINRYATEIAINSNAVGRNVLGRKLERRAKVIHNGVFSTGIECNNSRRLKESFGIPENHFVVGVPSTLRPMKGQEQIILALPRLIEQYPNVSVVMLGDHTSSYGERMKRLASSLGLSPHVIFVGTISSMVDFYGMSDVVCIPSIAEPFGRVAIEAFFAESPVVASAVGGLKEIITHKQTGLLFQAGDIEALVANLIWVIENPTAGLAMVKRARDQAGSLFTESKYRSKVLHILNAALEA